MERATFESPHLRTLFTNSEMVRGEIARFYPKVDLRKIVVVHNGVEWTDYAQPFARGFQERAALTRDLGLDNGCHQFLFVGHEYQKKGLSLLMKALARLIHDPEELESCLQEVVERSKNYESARHIRARSLILTCIRSFRR